MSDVPVKQDQTPHAFTRAQNVRPGCQHQLGCKCTPPYYLRASTPDEQKWEARVWGKVP